MISPLRKSPFGVLQRRRRVFSFRAASKVSGLVPVPVVLALVATTAAAATVAGSPIDDPGAASPQSVSAETMIGGVTAEEEATRQASLHGRLMSEIPPGVLAAPIVVDFGFGHLGQGAVHRPPVLR